jgi:hypothetical protein
LVLRESIHYSGRELRSGWIGQTAGLEGDAVVAFSGSCLVVGDDLVDLEDRRAGLTVEGRRMLHFISEVADLRLPGIAFAQRLLCTIAARAVDRACGEPVVERRGDDLFVGEGKLSVSIATESGKSGLIHLGLNITTDGVPVRAACLEDLGIDPMALASEVAELFAREVEGGLAAAGKVARVP